MFKKNEGSRADIGSNAFIIFYALGMPLILGALAGIGVSEVLDQTLSGDSNVELDSGDIPFVVAGIASYFAYRFNQGKPPFV